MWREGAYISQVSVQCGIVLGLYRIKMSSLVVAF